MGFTARVSDTMGVMVLTRSVSVCVRVRVPLSWLNGQTYRPEFWHVGQLDDYLGQVCRCHRSKVTRSKTFLMGISMDSQ